MRAVTALAVGALMGAVAFPGCTSGQRKAISETAVRNAVAIAGAKEFNDHGFPIKNGLTCSAKATNSSGTHVAVSCHGTTIKGQGVALIGTTDDKSASSGNFVGTVDGLAVFRKSCLGCKV